MITGIVTERREAITRIQLRGDNGVEKGIDAIIDTGFTGYLTLPSSQIKALGYPYIETVVVVLADDSQIEADLYQGAVVWEGKERAIAVYCMEGQVLLGMSLLFGNRFTMDVVPSGLVTIAELA